MDNNLTLHSYQRRAIDFCSSHDKAILSVSMGLGKTASVLHYIDNLKPRTLIIVAPKFVALHVWKQECLKWGLTDLHDKLTIAWSTSKEKRRQLIQDNDYLIVTRDNLDDVKGKEVDLLVLDELTSFKKHDTKRSRVLHTIKAKQRIGLTGTFITNSAIDVYGQLVAVGFMSDLTQKEVERNFYRWRSAYFKDVMAGSGMKWSKWKLTVPLDYLLRKVKDNIFTLDSKDWLDIPEVTYIKHPVKLTKNEFDEYLRLNTMLNVNLGDETIAFTEAQKFAKLQTLCDGFVYTDSLETGLRCVARSDYSTKLDEVVAFVEQCVDENEQVLLFYAFIEEKNLIKEKLKKIGVKFTDSSDKNFLQKWNDQEVEVLMGHPASMSHGLNLQKGSARIMVWSSLPFDLELFLQANARLARQGQKRGVQIHSFVAEGTVEVRKYLSLFNKQKLLDEFIEITK